MTPQLRAKLDEHRHARAAELYELAELLQKHGLTADTEPVTRAAGQCLGGFRTAPATMPDAGRTYWGYDITDLRIGLEAQRHCRPRAATMENVSGLLTVTVQEYVPDDPDTLGKSFSLLRKLDTDFHFEAALSVEGDLHPLRAAWHVDTHLYTGQPTRAVHPRFHFQVGGEKLDDVDLLIRGVFMPEAPRVPCAPLDGLLAVDFVLSHYCGESWDTLRDMETRYRHLRKGPLQRYWRPYFQKLSDGIAALDDEPGGGEANMLIPNIFAD